jgi:hypothetical protein
MPKMIDNMLFEEKKVCQTIKNRLIQIIANAIVQIFRFKTIDQINGKLFFGYEMFMAGFCPILNNIGHVYTLIWSKIINILHSLPITIQLEIQQNS